MLWIAALLSFIIWVLGWQSGFLGPVIHVFLLLALLAVLAALLPPRLHDMAAGTDRNEQASAAEPASPTAPDAEPAADAHPQQQR